MFSNMFFFSILLCLKLVSSQFFEAESLWQFAGFAALNIPATETNEINPYFSQYSQLQQQLQLQQLQSSNRFEQQQQQLQQQSLISSPHNTPLLPNAIPIPKQLPDFSRGGTTLEHATYLSLINDKENFQASGCGWDLIRMQCHDLFGLCKGGCRDFAIAINSPIHDCRCIPFGYLALVKLPGR